MRKIPLIVRCLRHLFLFVFSVLLFVNCSENEVSSYINKDNLDEKLAEAFSEITEKGSFELAEKVLEFIDKNKVKIKEPRLLGLQKFLIADSYLTLKHYELAEANFESAITIFERLDDGDKLAQCYNGLGILFYSQKEFSHALELFRVALEKSEDEKFPATIIDINYNMVFANSNIGALKKAEFHAKKVIALVKQYNIKVDNLKFCYQFLANNAMNIGDYEVAKKYIAQALESPCINECYLAKRNFYKKYATIYTKEGKYKLANEYYAKALANFDKHELERNKTHVAQVTAEINQKQNISISKMEALKEQRLILNTILVFLAITIIYIFSLMKQRLKIKKTLNEINELNFTLQKTLINKDSINLNLEAKKNEVQSLLKLNERTLFSKELKLSTIKENISKIVDEISKLSTSDTKIKPNQLLGIEKSLLAVITNEGIWKDFKIQFEQIRPNFFDDLKKKYPELSVNDMKHCSYIVSNLKNKDVANLINVSSRSVETARYRIKKKMNLDKDQDLYSILLNL